MSVFRKFINHYNSLPNNSIINSDSISIQLWIGYNGDSNIYICVGRYIDYLVDGQFIEYSHSVFEQVEFLDNIILDKMYYTKKCDIPNIDTLTIRKLKRLSNDNRYRVNYMRKAKLKTITTILINK